MTRGGKKNKRPWMRGRGRGGQRDGRGEGVGGRGGRHHNPNYRGRGGGGRRGGRGSGDGRGHNSHLSSPRSTPFQHANGVANGVDPNKVAHAVEQLSTLEMAESHVEEVVAGVPSRRKRMRSLYLGEDGEVEEVPNRSPKIDTAPPSPRPPVSELSQQLVRERKLVLILDLDETLVSVSESQPEARGDRVMTQLSDGSWIEAPMCIGGVLLALNTFYRLCVLSASRLDRVQEACRFLTKLARDADPRKGPTDPRVPKPPELDFFGVASCRGPSGELELKKISHMGIDVLPELVVMVDDRVSSWQDQWQPQVINIPMFGTRLATSDKQRAAAEKMDTDALWQLMRGTLEFIHKTFYTGVNPQANILNDEERQAVFTPERLISRLVMTVLREHHARFIYRQLGGIPLPLPSNSAPQQSRV